MKCNTTKFVGRVVALEYAIACGENLPREEDWKRFGSLRTKEFSLEWDTTDATDSDSVGALRENLATFQSLSISGDGTVKASGAGSQNLKEITKHVADPKLTGGQPKAFLRMTFPDLTFTCFMLLSNLSRSAPYDDVVTFSLEASATASDFGLIVEDTPDASAGAPESISIIPETLKLAINESFDVESVVLPTNSNQAVRWDSADTSIAMVNPISGVVTGTGLGTATITAVSSVDSGVSNSIDVEVVSVASSIDVVPSTVSITDAETEQLTFSVVPPTAPQGVTFVSDDPLIASVNSTGLIEGQSAGETFIKVKSEQRPSVTTEVPVTVTGA